MNTYHRNGLVAVATVESDNLAGFGARRFMQDMYQPQHDYIQGSNHYAHHNSEPSHQSSHQNEASRHDRYYPYGPAPHHEYPDSSQYQPSGYQETSSSYVDDIAYGQHHHSQQRNDNQDRYQIQRRQPQYDQISAHCELPASTAASSTHTGAERRTVWRSDSLESSATDSTAGLAYARSGDSQYSHNRHQQADAAFNSSRTVAIPRIKVADRATIYEDDYEEPVDPRPPSPASATLGDVSTDASFTIVRATVLEPDLPKAKCADCGEKLDFEELANHSCQSSGSFGPPLLTIQVPPSSSSSTLSSSASTSPALTTPRSPFFDRYDTMLSDTGPLSPALFGTLASFEGSQSQKDEDETPKAHAVRIMGTQAAIKVSTMKASTRADAAQTLPQKASPLLQLAATQRSASDTDAEAAAVARRKMIEEQRAAKRKETMNSPMPRAATTSNIAQQGGSSRDGCKVPPRRGASISASTSKHMQTPSATEAQHAKTGSSSSVSSTGTDASGRMGFSSKYSSPNNVADGASSPTNITPSSSYEQIDEGLSKDEGLSLKVCTTSIPSTSTRARGPVDLSSIEEMMKGLTASPEPLHRTLTDSPRKSGQSREVAPANAQRSRSTSGAHKTERERALEHELERLRDKERTRQLQALRLKEKRRKERAAKRCCICDCSLSSSRTPFVERDGKLLCARDWKELYLPKCRKCNLIVEKGAVKSSDGALRGVFHRSCFSCAACETPFTDGSFYVFNNQPYCSRHYHRLNGSLCRECESGIEGDCRQTDTGDRFHPQCFNCQYSSNKNGVCKEALADYYIVGGQRLCERHANKISRKLAKAGQKQLDLRAQKRMTMLHSLK